jgi:hypothetical protein
MNNDTIANDTIEITLIQNLSHWEWERFRPKTDDDSDVDNGGIDDGDWYPLMGGLMAEILAMDLGIPVEFKEWDIYRMNYFEFTIDKKIVEKMMADGVELEERLNIYLDEGYIIHQDYLFDKMQDLCDRMYEYERPNLLTQLTDIYEKLPLSDSIVTILTESYPRNERIKFNVSEFCVIDIYQYINSRYDVCQWIVYPTKDSAIYAVEPI